MAASQGDLWLREAVQGDEVEPRYATQRRWTEQAGLLLGLVADATVASGVREALDVEGLDHERARRISLRASTMAERGTAVVSVLDRLVMNEALWGRLLHAGYLSGVWAQPFLWDPRISRRVFPRPGTAVSSRPRGPL